MEAKLAFVAANKEVIAIKQKKMDDRMKVMNSRQDTMGADLKAVWELLKKPWALEFSYPLFYLF